MQQAPQRLAPGHLAGERNHLLAGELVRLGQRLDARLRAELVQRGEKVYAANCVACHQANGKGVPGAFPALDGSAIVIGPKSTQISLVLNGKGGMPPWKGVLSDTDIAAVITYTRNSWSNKAQENIVQPAEVLAARK